MFHRSLSRASLVLVLVFFLALVWIAGANSAWVANADDVGPSIPTPQLGPEFAVEGRDPPPWLYFVLTAQGGQGAGPGEGCFVFVLEGTAPAGSQVTVSKFYPSSVPKGAFRSINDRICAVKLSDPSGQELLSFEKPIKVCFKISPAEAAVTPVYIDWWNWLKGRWDSQAVVPGTAPDHYCVAVNQL